MAIGRRIAVGPIATRLLNSLAMFRLLTRIRLLLQSIEWRKICAVSPCPRCWRGVRVIRCSTMTLHSIWLLGCRTQTNIVSPAWDIWWSKKPTWLR